MLDCYTLKKLLYNGMYIETFDTPVIVIADILFIIISIIVILYAMSLAWKCNKGSEKYIMVVIAFIIPYLYIIGYFIYHYLLGYPCNNI